VPRPHTMVRHLLALALLTVNVAAATATETVTTQSVQVNTKNTHATTWHVVVHASPTGAPNETLANRAECLALAGAADTPRFVEVQGLRAALQVLGARAANGSAPASATTTTAASAARVYLCPGTHMVEQSLQLGPEHSFSSFVGLSGTPGPAVVSGALEVRNFTRVPATEQPARSTGVAAPLSLWSSAIPAGSLDRAQNFTMPQQLFASRGGSSVRRTRARHPNLPLDSNDTYPWLHWASQLCPAKKVPSGQPSPPCNEWARYGFVWNATDDEVFDGLGNGTPAVDVQAVVYHGWTASRHHLRSVVAENRSLLFTNPAQSFIGFFGLDNTGEGGRRYYLSNHRSFLDFPGEWFLDNSTAAATNESDGVLYYLASDDLEEAALEDGSFAALLPRHTTLLTITGASNVTFVGPGLQISYSNWECETDQVCDRQSTEWLESSGVRVVNSSGVQFRNVELSHHGGFPVWIDRGSNDATVDSCDVHDVAAGGVRLGHSSRTTVPPDDPVAGEEAAVHRAVIFNTSITDGGHDFPSGTAVFSQYRVQNLTVQHCEISRFSYTAISLGWSWDYQPQVGCCGVDWLRA